MAAVLTDEEIHNLAKARVEFRHSAVTFVAVNLFLIGVWWFTSRAYYWPIWVHLGWGLGLAFQGWRAYGTTGKDAIAREEEKLRRKFGRA